MNKWEKIITMIIAIGGGIAGIWGAYASYETLKFKQPIDEHIAIAQSYLSQIDSAEKRKDEKEVKRIRSLYESFEERWRSAREIAVLVSPIEKLITTKLSTEQTKKIGKLLSV